MDRCMRKALLAAMFLFPGVSRADVLWGLGLRTSAQAIRSFDTGDGTALAGGGLQLRFRFGATWGLEIAVEELRGNAADGAYRRESCPMTVTGSYHFDLGAVDFYLLAGIGGTKDEVSYVDAKGMTIEEDVRETHVHLGVGVERLFGPIGLAAELRGVAMWRKDADTTMPYAAVPAKAGGAELNLIGTYYF